MKSSVSKYRAKKVEIDGIKFDSQKEGKRYLELKLLQSSGAILGLQVHKRLPIIDKSKYGREIVYVADFVYLDAVKNKNVIEDVKGYKGGSAYAHYKLKKRLVAERYGMEIVEI